jgi:protein SCO1/2
MYGAKYEIVPTPESAARYTVSHSTTLYVLDKQGKVVEQFPYEATAGEIADAVRAMLEP